jgi:hypothetical protein
MYKELNRVIPTVAAFCGAILGFFSLPRVVALLAIGLLNMLCFACPSHVVKLLGLSNMLALLPITRFPAIGANAYAVASSWVSAIASSRRITAFLSIYI